MNAKEIVEKYLKDNGYDGLCNSREACGCRINDLFPCESDFSQCRAGHKFVNDAGETVIIPEKASHAEDVITKLSQFVSGYSMHDRHATTIREAVELLRNMIIAIRFTLEENKHPAGGDNCTLWRLRQVVDDNWSAFTGSNQWKATRRGEK
jgi:hypothetical protein